MLTEAPSHRPSAAGTSPPEVSPIPKHFPAQKEAFADVH